MHRKSLYILMLTLSAAGMLWLYIDHSLSGATLCLFKSATGLPCPSCGTTRSLLLLLQGDLQGALFVNPLGIAAAIALAAVPVWILIDLLRSTDSFYRVYCAAEAILRSNRFAAACALAAVAGNWIWNISKGL